MKVVCIDTAHIKPCFCGSTKTRLTEGDKYDVTPDEEGDDAYDVKGLERCDNCLILQSYAVWRFVPLSDIDEKEMEREWMLTPVELPNQVN